MSKAIDAYRLVVARCPAVRCQLLKRLSHQMYLAFLEGMAAWRPYATFFAFIFLLYSIYINTSFSHS